MRAAPYIVLFVATQMLAATQSQSSAPHVLLTPEEAARFGVHTPQPQYPVEARQRHITGSGIFRMHVYVKTGLVRSLEIERSTGHAILDSAVITAFQHWRFRPQILQKHADPRYDEIIVRVPVTFALRKT
jgi:TonB family protein